MAKVESIRGIRVGDGKDYWALTADNGAIYYAPARDGYLDNGPAYQFATYGVGDDINLPSGKIVGTRGVNDAVGDEVANTEAKYFHKTGQPINIADLNDKTYRDSIGKTIDSGVLKKDEKGNPYLDTKNIPKGITSQDIINLRKAGGVDDMQWDKWKSDVYYPELRKTGKIPDEYKQDYSDWESDTKVKEKLGIEDNPNAPKEFTDKLQKAKDNGYIDQAKFDKYSKLAGSGYEDIAQQNLDKDVNDFLNPAEQAPTFDYNKFASESGLDKISGELQAVVDKGEPTFVKPEDMTTYVQKWIPQLEALDKPQVDKAMQGINKSMGEQYAFYNPYSLGSGSQVKMTQDATTDLMTDVIANRNARALALGEGEFNQDYNKNLLDYQYKQTQRDNANNQLLDIANAKIAMAGMKTDQERTDYWNNMKRSWDINDTRTAQDYQTSMANLGQVYNRENQKTAYNYQNALMDKEQKYAEKVAGMYQPKQSSFWDYVAPIATGIGYGAGGAFGAAGANAITKAFKPKKQTKQDYTYTMDNLPGIPNAYVYNKP